MNTLFWSVVALDALMFTVLLVMTLGERGHGDGGREMGIAFFIVLPSLVIGAAVLLFVFTDAFIWHLIALAVVAGPGLFIAGGQVRNVWIDHVIAENASGRGYFEGSALRAMGAAVVQRDVATLQRIGPTVDVNTVGERGMTLIALAVDRHAGLDVVRALLALGAKPAPAMPDAARGKELDILAALLDAGGDPNMTIEKRGPLIFEGLQAMPIENFALLTQHGLNLDSTDNGDKRGDPLAVVITITRRWDLLAFLIEHGADIDRPRSDGRHVAGEIAAQVSAMKADGQPIPRDLARVEALLAARVPRPATGASRASGKIGA